jgi:hypothetical protein
MQRYFAYRPKARSTEVNSRFESDFLHDCRGSRHAVDKFETRCLFLIG